MSKYNIFKEASTNIIFLGITQFINYVIPILLIPYFVKVIGIVNIGKISIIQTLIFYGTTIVNYGFNYSGTIEVAKDKENDHSPIFSSIISSKIALSIVSSFLAITILFFFKTTTVELILIYFSFLLHFIGQSLYPEWFFHGLQKVKYAFFTIIIWKTLYLALVLVFVRKQEDYLAIIFYDSLLLFLLSIGSFFFAKKKFDLKFNLCGINVVKSQLTDNWHLFSSIVLTTFYTKGNYLFLGLCSTQIEVAIYSIVERYIFMINGLLSLLNRVLLPYLTIFRQKNIERYHSVLNLTTTAVILIGVLLCSLNLVFSVQIVENLNDKYQADLLNLLYVLSFSFISSSFCTFVTHVLISESEDKQINKINMVGLLVGIVWVAPLTYFFGGLGLAFGFVSNSYFLAFMNALSLRQIKKRLLIHAKSF